MSDSDFNDATDTLVADRKGGGTSEAFNPKELIRHKAMDLLARREHSRLELYRKLGQRFPDAHDFFDAVLDRLSEENLQSDQRFAESFVRSRVSKGQGPQRIATELQQRGVESFIVSQVIQDCGIDWLALAVEVLNKKYHRRAMDYKEKAKRSRFLQYRGFDMEQIKAAISMVI